MRDEHEEPGPAESGISTPRRRPLLTCLIAGLLLCGGLTLLIELPALQDLWRERGLRFGGLDVALVALSRMTHKLVLWSPLLAIVWGLLVVRRPRLAAAVWTAIAGVLTAASGSFTLLAARAGIRWTDRLNELKVPDILLSLGGVRTVASVAGGVLIAGFVAAAAAWAIAGWASRRLPAATSWCVVGLLFAAGLTAWSAGHPALAAAGRSVSFFQTPTRTALPPRDPDADAWDAAVDDATADTRQRLAAALSMREPPVVPAVDPPGAPPDVVLLLSETFRRDGVDRELMPRLTARLHKGLWAAAHSSGGNASHLGVHALLDGRLSVQDGSHRDDEPRASSLVAWARSLGYETRFSSSGVSSGYSGMSRFLGPPAFDATEEGIGRGPEAGGGLRAADESVLRRVLDRLAEPAANRSPRLEVVFLMGPHYPYLQGEAEPIFTAASPPAWALGKPEAFRERQIDYANALRWLDGAVDGFLRALDAEAAGTLVVLTGDHGESFGDDGKELHGNASSSVQQDVPLWIRGPGVEPGVVTTLTSHTDVLPTVIDAVQRAAGTTRPTNPVFDRPAWLDPAAGYLGLSLLDPLPRDRSILITTGSDSMPLRWLPGRDDALVLLNQALESASAGGPIRLLLRHRPPWSREPATLNAYGWLEEDGRYREEEPPPVPVPLGVAAIEALLPPPPADRHRRPAGAIGSADAGTEPEFGAPAEGQGGR